MADQELHIGGEDLKRQNTSQIRYFPESARFSAFSTFTFL